MRLQLRWDEYKGREKTFVDKLEKCKLKEMVGWVEMFQASEDGNSKQVWLYAYDVFSVADEEPRYDYGVILQGMADEQVGEMKYGQRVKVSGKLGLNSEWGRVEVREPVYSLLEDDVVVGEAPTDDELKRLKVTLVRTMCNGFCPAYELSISGDGNVSFDGQAYTDVEGKAEGKIEQSQVAEMVREINKAEFFALKDSYEVMAFDVPSYSIRVELGGKTKEVKTDGPGPRKLFMLMNRVDQIANSAQWIGDRK